MEVGATPLKLASWFSAMSQHRWASWPGFLQKVHVMMALGFEYCTSIDGLCSEHSSSIGDLGSEHSSSINGCGHSPSICDLGF